MDTVRYFKDLAKGQLRQQRAAGRSDLQLQPMQHQVAVSAGYASWAILLRAPELDRQLAVVMDREPHLTRHGFGIGYSPRTPLERRTEFAELREELRESSERVHEVHGWLIEHVEPRKTINSAHGSYGLKDMAERDLGGYVANGEFIAAAIIADYPYRRHTDSPNASFGMSERSINVIWKRVYG